MYAASRSSAVEAPQRVAFVALRHRVFRTYLSTSVVSMVADNVEHVISYWVLWQAFHSPLLAGLAVITHWAPFLLFGVHFGALADRYDSRKLLQISQLILLLNSLAWGALFLTGHLQMWHALALLVFHGFGGALSAPAGQLLVHDVVGREHLQSAVRLAVTVRNLSLILGPAMGGGLMLLLGPGQGLMANALLYLPFSMWLLVTSFRRPWRRPEQAGGASAFGLGEAIKTLRQAAGHRTILAMVALGGLSSFLVGNAFQPQMPQFARDLGADDRGLLYSALLTAHAVGAVAGGLTLEGLRLFQPRASTTVVLGALWAGTLIAFAAAPHLSLALATLFLAGFFNLASGAMAQTLVQLEAPPDQRGRMVGLFNAAMGLRLGSGLTVGVWGAFIGIHWSLGLSSAMMLAASLALLAYLGFGRRVAGASPA